MIGFLPEDSGVPLSRSPLVGCLSLGGGNLDRSGGQLVLAECVVSSCLGCHSIDGLTSAPFIF